MDINTIIIVILASILIMQFIYNQHINMPTTIPSTPTPAPIILPPVPTKNTTANVPIVTPVSPPLHAELIRPTMDNVLVPLRPLRPAVNVRTRGDLGDWHTVGIVYTEDPHDDTTYVLYKRTIDYRRDQNQYIVRDANDVVIELSKNYMSLSSGDLITIPGKEGKGKFVVDLYSNESPRYTPYIL